MDRSNGYHAKAELCARHVLNFNHRIASRSGRIYTFPKVSSDFWVNITGIC